MKKLALKCSKGFTLVELSIVMIVLVVLGAVIMAVWPSHSAELNALTNQVASDIRYTQQLSATHNERYRMNLTSSSSYQIMDQNGTPINHPAGSNQTTTSLGTGFSQSSPGLNYLVFDGRGTPYNSTTASDSGTAFTANQTITITAPDGKSRIITIRPQTGYVSF